MVYSGNTDEIFRTTYNDLFSISFGLMVADF